MRPQNTKKQESNRAFGLAFSLFVFCCSNQVSAWAADNTANAGAANSGANGADNSLTNSAANNASAGAEDGAVLSQLDKIENKIFQHNYPKDTTAVRLERLENTVFGENKKGSTSERVAALVTAVPNLDNPPPASTISSETPALDNAADTNSANKRAAAKPKQTGSEDDNGDGVGNYPAVTAMETKLLGKDYAKEPIKDRLARLEKKALGSVSTSDDLSERVDRLKEATGIDVARKPASLSDWMEDDEDLPHSPSGRGGGDLSFGSPNVYQDMQRSSAPRDPYSSAYIPDRSARGPAVSIKSFGLSQQVLALEHEIFAKGYEHDPLPARLNRLETTVFPGQKPNTEMSLPQRVQILLAKVPIPQQELQALAKTYQIEPDNSLADNSNNDPNLQSIQKSRGNLSKIINSLGGMLGGGMAGGYPTNGGNYVLAPNTGMLVDPNTGYMINPNTGTAYGAQRNYQTNGYGSGNYGFNSFTPSMSPFGGSPYGMGGIGPGFGSGFGFGGGGMGMGGGGMGFGFR